MLERIQQFFFSKKVQRKSRTITEKKTRFIKKLLSYPYHSWIAEDPIINRSFTNLVNSFDLKVLEFFERSKKLVFIQATGTLACSLSTIENAHIIIIFPDLHRLLKSASPEHGIAILVHELGHIYHGHSGKNIHPLKAQIEADIFATSLGFGHQLQDILMDYQDSEDCQVRINYLTSILTKKAS